ncbi:MAG: glycosyltransferase family 2 protein [Clostridia bacterium]|nr:glycosyltransferase family 2 protein [Clostridia bacterium]
MKLEVLLSVMNLRKENLDKMHITSKCTVIDQCGKKYEEKYNSFNIFGYNEIGLSNSRNRGLEHSTEEILILCDDDVVYNEDYEKNIVNEFISNPKADVIYFNVNSPYRKYRIIKKRKRLHIYNSLNYASCNIAFRRKSIENKNIKFNNMFGPNAKWENGSDTIFIRDVLKNKLKIYSCPINLGTVYHRESTWFKGYDERYFFNKGALFTAISKRFRHLLLIQYLLRHREVFKDFGFNNAYKAMIKGSNDYLKDKKGYIEYEKSKCNNTNS